MKSTNLDGIDFGEKRISGEAGKQGQQYTASH